MSQNTDLENQQVTNLDDTNLVAYLMLKGYRVIPWKLEDDPSRVSFDICGDPSQITQDIQLFFDNEQVGVQDFVRNLKEVKSQMYQMKRIGKGQG